MKKTKRVIIIDPFNLTVQEATVTDLEDMQEIVGGYIERGLILENADEVYVNEEGLFKTPNYFYTISGYQFCGKSYLIGGVDSRGYNHGAKSTVAEIKNSITWLGKGELV